MKNLLAADSCTAHVSSAENKCDILEQKYHTHPEMAALECRQQKILEQLAELKDQMLALRGVLKVTTTSAIPNTYDIKPIQLLPADLTKIENLSDLVINVNPAYPPFSLLFLQKAWSNCLQLVIHIYQHSTTVTSSKNAQDFMAQVQKQEINSSLPQITIRLIWKEVDGNVELITSSSVNTPIYGEVNVLRYLSRVNSDIIPAWNYESTGNGTDIDSVLDICYMLSKSRTKTERTSLLQLINGKLGKSQWLCNSERISIADVATYSVIKQVTNANDINVNLNKLLQRCEQVYA
ncbi:aaRS-interacting multifunctional protein 2 [Carabus blaptoides fortunei]